MKKIDLFKCLSTLFLLVAVQSVSAQQDKLRGTIDGGVVRGKPIAIVPFKVLDGSVMEHQIHEVVAFDLDASGKFESIPVKDFLSQPSKDEEVRFKDWRFLNAEILVIGEVWNLGVVVIFHFFIDNCCMMQHVPFRSLFGCTL